MAKKEAKVVITGSGYGAMKDHSRLEGHLKYELTDSLKKWQVFFKTGILHEPAPEDIPDEFLINEKNLDFLLATLDQENKDNWYAHYQAGIGFFSREDYAGAEKELKRSWYLKKSAWAAHALAAAAVLSGHDTETIQWIHEGLKLEHKNLSYLKDALKLLFYCKDWDGIIRWYECLDGENQKAGKLKYYYISALYHTGKTKEAFALLEENGGLEIPDIREGEDSIAQLYLDIQKNLTGEDVSLPFKYDFRATNG